jgi:CYTH domain-containing protein
MPLEIERKFLVLNDKWRHNATGINYSQGYLSTYPGTTIRVRTQGEKAFLTIKSRSQGISRSEFEYEIPLKEALELQSLCSAPLVKKTRYQICHKNKIWEVDEFHGDNEGLVIAEIELNDPKELITLPPWVGEEVSCDQRYFNSNLALHPFTKWDKSTNNSVLRKS